MVTELFSHEQLSGKMKGAGGAEKGQNVVLKKGLNIDFVALLWVSPPKQYAFYFPYLKYVYSIGHTKGAFKYQLTPSRRGGRGGVWACVRKE